MSELFIQIRALRQSLSEGKAPLGLFLGAGCPLSIRVDGSPLIPDITSLTEKISEKLEADKTYHPHFEAIKNQVGPDENIEAYLSFIRSLSQVVRREKIYGLAKDDIEALELEICNQIYDFTKAALPDSQTSYHRMGLWIRSIVRLAPVEIFTPNYDLLIEQAMEELRIPYFDGFIGSRQPFFDPYAMEEDLLSERWVRLWKIHGSINWALKTDAASEKFVCRCDPRFIDKKERRLIHPSHLKYDESRRMPYLAMIDRLKNFLRIPGSRLFICGYSFSDVHLNEVLRQSLGANPRAHAFGFLFSELDKHPKAKKLAFERPNLSILSQDKSIIGSKTNAYGETSESLRDLTEPLSVDWEPTDKSTSGEQMQRGQSGAYVS